MILHAADWAKYPKAVPHWETKNQSFLKMVARYRLLGIQNCLFPLALLQPHLKDVDPHDPTLSDEMKMSIWTEVVHNPWYFLREVVRVPAGDSIPYIANRGNIALTWLFLNHIDTFLIQPRQTGKSVSTDCLMIWLMYFACHNVDITLITKDHNLRSKNIARLKEIRDEVPDYLIVKDKSDLDNTEGLTYNSRKMAYRAFVPRSSAKDAAKVGRGGTSPIMHFDEPPYQNHIGVTFPSATGSMNNARLNAERLNKPYGVILTTTAGKIDDRDGKYVYDMLTAAAPWTERFLDAGDIPQLNQMIGAMCQGPAIRVNCTFSHRQLGYTDEWLWQTMARNEIRGEDADRDYMNRWTNGTGSNPVNGETLARLAKHEREPDHVQMYKGGYVMNWYVPKDKIEAVMANGQFIMGLDTSDAIGRDGIAAYVIDTRDLSLVCCGTFNRTNIYVWISWLGQFLITHRNITLIPEKKSSAQTIIDGLITILDAAGEDPFRRIFNQVVQNRERYEDDLRAMQHAPRRRQLYETHKQLFGFNTSADTRTTLYVDVMQAALEEAAHVVRDAAIISEFRGLVVKNGRVDHQTGGHDDRIVSWLLANWLLLHGRNLSYYGINTKSIRSLVVKNADSVTVADQLKSVRDKQLRNQIDELSTKLAEAEHDSVAMRLELQLRNLMSRVRHDNSAYESIQEIIDGAAMRRKERGRRQRSDELPTRPLYQNGTRMVS